MSTDLNKNTYNFMPIKLDVQEVDLDQAKLHRTVQMYCMACPLPLNVYIPWQITVKGEKCSMNQILSVFEFSTNFTNRNKSVNETNYENYSVQLSIK